MGKRVIILSSSPRRGGNSDTLCDQFMNGALEAGHSVEKISLREKKIAYCTGCGTCVNGKRPCPQHDDASSIMDKMIAADVIVMATPVYFYTVCAQMKTLIDRCCGRYTEISGKEFYFIVAAAENSVPAMRRTVEDFRGFLDCLDAPKERGVVYGMGAWQVGDIKKSPAMKDAYEMGRTV